ncbi:TonB-dependent receptor plug domain-containing protein [Thermomonas alba]|uniref:TonB-dependent receptor plug domain-containing protein n=1 Tax=Thermomonas alba TaxID=2888525 RepID=UPI001F0453A4|nr:TonB-dependent receptor [Thermomonas alba]
MSSKTRHIATPLRCTVLAAALLCALSVQAQDSGATGGAAKADKKEQKQQGVTQLDSVVVTGTHQAGLSPVESISPIDSFSAAALQSQGSADVTETLTRIVPSLNTQRFPIADGTAFVRPVTLRNLSPDQTLVLVNGVRRHRSALVNLQLAPLGTVNQGAQAVDFSAIPASAVERVEVLRDGAAVLYGSDAIAGVVNVILKDSPEGASVSVQHGKYSKGDGARLRIDADAGFPLGATGFVHVSAERDTSDITSRGVPRADAAAIAAIVGADKVPYNGYGQRWGDPDIRANKLFVNTALPLEGDKELYGFGSYMDNKTLSGFFYRAPVLPPQYQINGRSTLIHDGNGDFLPDNAPRSLVDAIINAGLNPADYLTADANSPSGWVELNPIYQKFPGGYSPLFGADISDYELVAGVRGGMSGDFQWDVHARRGRNQIDYRLENSINPSLGRLSPTSFRPGTLTQEESELGVDFVQHFADSPMTLAYGAQWRDETYKIGTGDAASIAVGPTAAVFGVGSDGFQGFFPESAGTFKQKSQSAYIDAETSLTEKWSAALAGRYEHAERFGSSFVYKLSSRYAFTDRFSLRGTYNTGFRTPTPGQAFTLNVTTTADASGNLIPSGTYPVSHPVSQALGAQPLQTEKSRNLSVGAVWLPRENVTVTLDAYMIQVRDRIGLITKTVDQNAVNALNAMNYPNANLLLGSAASYFGNAFDSHVRGVDFVIDTRHDLWGGVLNVDFRYNYNKQDVVHVKPGTINGDRIYDLEHQVPSNRSVLSFDYGRERWHGVLRLNNYGGWSTTGGLFGNGDASDAVSYSGKTLVDLEARYKLNDAIELAVGGDNVFDVHPGKEQNPVLQFLGVKYALTSPFGFNGAFWYARISVKF